MASLASSGSSVRLAVFAFGRFQPPHSKHAEMIDTVIRIANENGGHAFLFTSQKDNKFEDNENARKFLSTGSDKIKKKMSENPLKIADKLRFLHFYHGDKSINIVPVNEVGITTPFQATGWLISQGYNSIIMIGGEDRKDLLTGIGKMCEKVGVKFNSVAIERSKDSASGTQARAIADAGNFDEFYAYIGGDEPCKRKAQELMRLLQQGSRPSGGGGDSATKVAGGYRKRKTKRRRKTKRKRRRKKRTRRKKGGNGKKWLLLGITHTEMKERKYNDPTDGGEMITFDYGEHDDSIIDIKGNYYDIALWEELIKEKGENYFDVIFKDGGQHAGPGFANFGDVRNTANLEGINKIMQSLLKPDGLFITPRGLGPFHNGGWIETDETIDDPFGDTHQGDSCYVFKNPKGQHDAGEKEGQEEGGKAGRETKAMGGGRKKRRRKKRTRRKKGGVEFEFKPEKCLEKCKDETHSLKGDCLGQCVRTVTGDDKLYDVWKESVGQGISPEQFYATFTDKPQKFHGVDNIDSFDKLLSTLGYLYSRIIPDTAKLLCIQQKVPSKKDSSRLEDIFHWIIIARTGDNNLFLIDPKWAIVSTNKDILSNPWHGKHCPSPSYEEACHWGNSNFFKPEKELRLSTLDNQDGTDIYLDASTDHQFVMNQLKEGLPVDLSQLSSSSKWLLKIPTMRRMEDLEEEVEGGEDGSTKAGGIKVEGGI